MFLTEWLTLAFTVDFSVRVLVDMILGVLGLGFLLGQPDDTGRGIRYLWVWFGFSGKVILVLGFAWIKVARRG